MRINSRIIQESARIIENWQESLRINENQSLDLFQELVRINENQESLRLIQESMRIDSRLI